jgi:23S rRNA pseudouridine1911/1915/1917 synthase
MWSDWVIWNQRALALQWATRATRGAVQAVLHYEVREAFDAAALLEVRLVTGRQNQIRAQAMMHGCPLVGEEKYDGADAVHAAGETGEGAPRARAIEHSRQALHAHRLGFAHPLTGAAVTFASPMPKDLQRLLERLRAGVGP